MTTQELNERINPMQEDNRMVDLYVAACGLIGTLMMVLTFWEVFP